MKAPLRTPASALVCLALAALFSCGGEAPAPVPPAAPPPPLAVATLAPPPAAPRLAYPSTRRDDVTETLHGVTVADPYRWLEDGTRDDVKKWAGEQDAFARAELAKLPGRDAIARRMKELSYVERVEAPHHRGTRWFIPRREAGKEKTTIFWREGKDGADKVLLDPASWAADGSMALGEWNPSWDGKRVAYSVRGNNSDESTMYVMDVATGKKSEIDVIEGAKYAWPSWTASGDGFYYVRVPPVGSVPVADRPGYADVRFHKLGQSPSKDTIVHEKTGDPKSFLSVDGSRDGRWLFVTTEHGWTHYDVEFMDLRAPKPAWKSLAMGRDAIFKIDVDQGHFFVRTNDGAPRYRVFKVDPAHAERDKWIEIVPERADATLEWFSVVGHELALGYLKDVVSYPEIRDFDGKLVRAIDLPAKGASSRILGNPDDDLAYYSFQSFTYPPEIFETSIKTGKTTSWHKLKLPIEANKYESEQRFATSKDGTKVPYFVVRAKDLAKDGQNKTLLVGYGGFQVAQTPYFGTSVFPWLENGGVWVSMNLRGGSEYGEEWHRHGMRHEKQHVFDDLFAIAQDLVKDGYTSPQKLGLLGGSNGGLLVGAAITERPELFRVALCMVPLLDMVRYHLFGSGKTWIDEYGSADDPEDFKALYAYSPYHHVVKGTKYPATLLLSADSDDRVDPMHARKFAAALQAASTDGPVLLRIEKHSGHGGADMVRARVEQVADEYAFALDQMKD